MTRQALIYEEPVPVTKRRHGRYAVRRVTDYSFARDLNAVPLVMEEFPVAGRNYPIVFTRSGDHYGANALLGLRNAENLFVDKAGKWLGGYVPAFLRRYPFALSYSEEKETYAFCIDEGASVVGEYPDGERLFDDSGNETPYFNEMLAFVKQYQKAYHDTQAFCARLKDLGLIADIEVSLKLPTGETATNKGFFGIHRERLKDLKSDQVDTLFRAGDLEHVHIHLASLHAFETLLLELPREPLILN
jgi:hypothetical protein